MSEMQRARSARVESLREVASTLLSVANRLAATYHGAAEKLREQASVLLSSANRFDGHEQH